MAFQSYLKPNDSMIVGIGVAGAVFAIYQLNLGTGVQVQMTDANHPATESARKKSGYVSAVFVVGIGVMAKDPTVIILGAAAIVAMEINYRHSIMAHPETGQMVPPDESTYMPAGQAVSSMYEQEASGVAY